jgi:uncharacterized membrane protein YhiD involved in acid resistance
MPDFLVERLLDGPALAPLTVLVRLAAAMALGGVVALVYRGTRPADALLPSFIATLVLLSILIAMVTQIIGDNVARAFSLVGALSIVRFRTVVRDTQDTAYVIFAVAVGMAAGAGHYFVAIAGIGIVAVTARLMRQSATAPAMVEAVPFELSVRVGIGQDRLVIASVLDEHAAEHRLVSIATGRQGLTVDLVYRGQLRREDSADAVVRGLNRIEGVQNITLRRLAPEDDANATGRYL